ncbi:MAG: hypothetical protein CMP68_04920 [Flavobacteriales bacterium]|nr:hypothetical protein [Flavobacteriales bacterium]
MKKLFFLFLICSFSLQAQITVEEKLQKPEINLKKKQNINQVWASGNWEKFNNEIIWKRGTWVNKRPGFIFMPGYWKKVKQGWSWVTSGWKKIDLKHWNKIYS